MRAGIHVAESLLVHRVGLSNDLGLVGMHDLPGVIEQRVDGWRMVMDLSEPSA